MTPPMRRANCTNGVHRKRYSPCVRHRAAGPAAGSAQRSGPARRGPGGSTALRGSNTHKVGQVRSLKNLDQLCGYFPASLHRPVPTLCVLHFLQTTLGIRKICIKRELPTFEGMTFFSFRREGSGTARASQGRFSTRRGRPRAISGAFERQSITPDRTAHIQLCPPRSGRMLTCNLRFPWRQRKAVERCGKRPFDGKAASTQAEPRRIGTARL